MGNAASELFKLLDIDKDRFLSKDELKKVASRTPFYKKADELIKIMDTNHDGKISLKEFRSCLKKTLKIEPKELQKCIERLKVEMQESKKPSGGIDKEETPAKEEVNVSGSSTKSKVSEEKFSSNQDKMGAEDETEKAKSMVSGDAKQPVKEKVQTPKAETEIKEIKSADGKETKSDDSKNKEDRVKEEIKESTLIEFKIGGSLSVWSTAKKKWFDGRIVAIDDIGSIQVRYYRGVLSKPGLKWVSMEERSVLLRPITASTVDDSNIGGMPKNKRVNSIPNSEESKKDKKVMPRSASDTSGHKLSSRTKVREAKSPVVAEGNATSPKMPMEESAPQMLTPVDMAEPKAPTNLPPAVPTQHSHTHAKRKKTPSSLEDSRIQDLIEIQNCLPEDCKINIIHKERKLLKHGIVMRKGGMFRSAHPGYLFLFNDLILSCTLVSRRSSKSELRKKSSSSRTLTPKAPVGEKPKGSAPKERAESARASRTSSIPAPPPTPADPSLLPSTNKQISTLVLEEADAKENIESTKPQGTIQVAGDAKQVKDVKGSAASSGEAGATNSLVTGLEILKGKALDIREVFRTECIKIKKGSGTGMFGGKMFEFGFSIVSETPENAEPVFPSSPSTHAPSYLDLGVETSLLEKEWSLAMANAAYTIHSQKNKEEKKRVKYGWATRFLEGTGHYEAWNGDEKGMQRVLAAVASDTEKRKELLETRLFDNKATPLLLAIRAKKPAVVKMLIEAKADVNVTDAKNVSPLKVTIPLRDLPTTKLLLKAGANPNEEYADGTSLLFKEIVRRKSESLDPLTPKKSDWLVTLLSAGAITKPQEKNKRGDTLLHLACNPGTEKWATSEVLEHILNLRPYYLRMKNNQGETPLHIAAHARKPSSFVSRLLGAGALPNDRTKLMKTPLHRATSIAAIALLKAGSRPDLMDKTQKPVDFKKVAFRKVKDKLDKAQLFWQKQTYEPKLYPFHAVPKVVLVNTGKGDTKKISKANAAEMECEACFTKLSSSIFKLWRKAGYKCARCGLIVCDKCSTKTVIDPEDNKKTVRVCDGCYNFCKFKELGMKAWGRGESRSLAVQRRELMGDDDADPSNRMSVPVRGVTNTMNQNIILMKERGKHLDEVGNKAEALSEDASEFASISKQLRKKMQNRIF